MARKQKAPGAGPNMAYLMSFGDTMTTLLAFFIVLNSLAKEQTGAKLYAGTGSFVSAVSSFGMPGSAPGDNSRHVIKIEEPVPTYVVPDPEGGEPEMGPGTQTIRTMHCVSSIESRKIMNDSCGKWIVCSM
jgi:hypothetical protein